jgi:hypothetical protein
MRKFNLRLFLLSSIAVAILAFFCFLGSFENSNSNVANIGLRILTFPLLTILSKFDLDLGFDEFLILLFLNSLLYGILMERVFSMLKRKKKKAISTGVQESKLGK